MSVTDNRHGAQAGDVTDSGPRHGNRSDTRNNFAAEEAKILGMKPPTPEEVERRRLRAQARRSGRVCEECEGEIGDDATVYRLRFPRRVGLGTQNTIETLCEPCAKGEAGSIEKNGRSFSRSLRYVTVLDRTGSEEEAKQAASVSVIPLIGRYRLLCTRPQPHRPAIRDTGVLPYRAVAMRYSPNLVE
jgi:hypothetical protein